jgi:hypothetical protein
MMMPIEIGIWRVSGGLERISFSSIETENRLESIICQDISILDPSLMLIGQQIVTPFGKRIDLLAVDSQGDLVIIELKRNRTPWEVVAQLLDYASWAKTLTYEHITSIYSERNAGKRFEEAFSSFFNYDPPEAINENHRLIIIATELDNSTERIIDYLSSDFGVPINAVFFRYFKDGSNEYLTRTWLIDPNLADSGSTGKGSKEPWNGRDWYASLGVGEHRNWDDCVEYGFISAGQGRWYSNTLQLLTPGARVFVCVPKNGYVGVGTVKDTAVRVNDFTVDVNGVETPILDLPLKAPKMYENADDPDLSEYLVRMEWNKTLSLDAAFWVKGMFANQNSACKLRNKFTLEKLIQHLQLEEE